MPSDSDRAIALVLAAGSGSRFGATLPKQLLMLRDRPVFCYSIDRHHALGHRVIIATSAETAGPIRDHVSRLDGAIEVVRGGATRRASLLASIDAIGEGVAPDTPVVLQNAASPNTPAAVTEAAIAGLEDHDGMVAYTPSEKTAFAHSDGLVTEVHQRSSMGFTTDPTAYRLSYLRRIEEVLRSRLSGDMSLDIACELGGRIGVVESPPSNIKLTTPGDLERLEDVLVPLEL